MRLHAIAALALAAVVLVSLVDASKPGDSGTLTSLDAVPPNTAQQVVSGNPTDSSSGLVGRGFTDSQRMLIAKQGVRDVAKYLFDNDDLDPESVAQRIMQSIDPNELDAVIEEIGQKLGRDTSLKEAKMPPPPTSITTTTTTQLPPTSITTTTTPQLVGGDSSSDSFNSANRLFNPSSEDVVVPQATTTTTTTSKPKVSSSDWMQHHDACDRIAGLKKKHRVRNIAGWLKHGESDQWRERLKETRLTSNEVHRQALRELVALAIANCKEYYLAKATNNGDSGWTTGGLKHQGSDLLTNDDIRDRSFGDKIKTVLKKKKKKDEPTDLPPMPSETPTKAEKKSVKKKPTTKTNLRASNEAVPVKGRTNKRR